MIKEFLPSILFLVKFVGIYLVLNLLYGVFINSFEPEPDPVTILVSENTSAVLSLVGFDSSTEVVDQRTGVWIYQGDQPVISVFEGCNGLNIIVIFMSFLLSYGRLRKELVWFIPLGIIVIHGINLFRITLLYIVSLSFPDYMYFTHKYIFTGILYVVIFVLWWYWVTQVIKRYSKG